MKRNWGRNPKVFFLQESILVNVVVSQRFSENKCNSSGKFCWNFPINFWTSFINELIQRLNLVDIKTQKNCYKLLKFPQNFTCFVKKAFKVIIFKCIWQRKIQNCDTQQVYFCLEQTKVFSYIIVCYFAFIRYWLKKFLGLFFMYVFNKNHFIIMNNIFVYNW